MKFYVQECFVILKDIVSTDMEKSLTFRAVLENTLNIILSKMSLNSSEFVKTSLNCLKMSLKIRLSLPKVLVFEFGPFLL